MVDEIELFNTNKIAKYKKDFKSLYEFIYLLKDLNVDYSNSGNSTITVGNMNIINFLNDETESNKKNYVFHNIFDDKFFFNKISFIFPKIDKNIRIARLYIGYKGSGTHIHNHSSAVNYLISEKKLWFVFPNTKHNNKKIKELDMTYKNIKIDTIDWFNSNYDVLTKNFENFETFNQEEGECIYIPDGYYHGVINLTRVFGFTYSWH